MSVLGRHAILQAIEPGTLTITPFSLALPIGQFVVQKLDGNGREQARDAGQTADTC